MHRQLYTICSYKMTSLNITRSTAGQLDAYIESARGGSNKRQYCIYILTFICTAEVKYCIILPTITLYHFYINIFFTDTDKNVSDKNGGIISMQRLSTSFYQNTSHKVEHVVNCNSYQPYSFLSF
jgi:hypothetical protein